MVPKILKVEIFVNTSGNSAFSIPAPSAALPGALGAGSASLRLASQCGANETRKPRLSRCERNVEH